MFYIEYKLPILNFFIVNISSHYTLHFHSFAKHTSRCDGLALPLIKQFKFIPYYLKEKAKTD